MTEHVHRGGRHPAVVPPAHPKSGRHEAVKPPPADPPPAKVEVEETDAAKPRTRRSPKSKA